MMWRSWSEDRQVVFFMKGFAGQLANLEQNILNFTVN